MNGPDDNNQDKYGILHTHKNSSRYFLVFYDNCRFLQNSPLKIMNIIKFYAVFYIRST